MASIQYSVIVPAYKENGNIRPLVTRIFAALRRIDSPVPADQTKIIIVDDNSRDGSVENVQSLQHEGYNVRIIVRTLERGLSSAVVRGFQEALGDSMLCFHLLCVLWRCGRSEAALSDGVHIHHETTSSRQHQPYLPKNQMPKKQVCRVSQE